jgi:hypothetical protein
LSRQWDVGVGGRNGDRCTAPHAPRITGRRNATTSKRYMGKGLHRGALLSDGARASWGDPLTSCVPRCTRHKPQPHPPHPPPPNLPSLAPRRPPDSANPAQSAQSGRLPPEPRHTASVTAGLGFGVGGGEGGTVGARALDPRLGLGVETFRPSVLSPAAPSDAPGWCFVSFRFVSFFFSFSFRFVFLFPFSFPADVLLSLSHRYMLDPISLANACLAWRGPPFPPRSPPGAPARGALGRRAPPGAPPLPSFASPSPRPDTGASPRLERGRFDSPVGQAAASARSVAASYPGALRLPMARALGAARGLRARWCPCRVLADCVLPATRRFSSAPPSPHSSRFDRRRPSVGVAARSRRSTGPRARVPPARCALLACCALHAPPRARLPLPPSDLSGRTHVWA